MRDGCDERGAGAAKSTDDRIADISVRLACWDIGCGKVFDVSKEPKPEEGVSDEKAEVEGIEVGNDVVAPDDIDGVDVKVD